ncbi:MAG TPA: tetratricopeptide repeat protein [Candidatus Cybelea sp.]
MTKSLAEVLRHFRAAAKLSQEALAERSGLSTRTVSDLETGAAQSPRLVTVMLLAEALGLSTEERTHLQQAARKPAGRQARRAPATVSTLEAPALVGRDEDVERLSALLSRDGVRLITLVGPAGVGKTSLAMRVAAECSGTIERGAVLTELAAVEDPSLVAAAVARSLGIRDSADAPASDAVTSYLRNRALLLVLDNLEHLTPAATWIGELLSACPRVIIIATSREPLHLQLERVYAVRPLRSEAAVRLFVERAQMVQPDFELSEANSAAVDTIVDHLEGLPLAIELAAPRLLLLPPRALAARLERRLPLLGNVSVDRPERQQTMHAAIAWSYDLLSPDEQRHFRRLSVLHGGSLAAAAAVAGEAAEERSILFRLAPLVDKNMLSLVEDTEAEPRVSMLEMLREFAQERLTESGELADANRRHAAYVLQFAEGAAGELSGSEQGRWLARFELEHANIETALAWASQNEETAFGCALLGSVWRYWWLRGYLTSGVSWVHRFLKLRRASPDAVGSPLYAKALRAFVVFQSALGNFDEAFAACEEALALQREIGDEAGLCASLTSLGIIFQHRGEYDRAEQAHAEALQIREQLRDEAGIANSLSNLASTAFSKNELSKAAALAERSASLHRSLGHESGLAHALLKVGLVAAREQNYTGAEDLFNECLRIQQAAHDTGSMYYSLVNLGGVAHKRRDYDLALARFCEALDLLETMPNKSALAAALDGIAATIAALGDPSRGARLMGAADTLRRAIGSAVFPSERADHEAELAAIRAQLGDESFDVQWRIGASSTLERAVEEARESVNVKHGPSSQRQPVLGS